MRSQENSIFDSGMYTTEQQFDLMFKYNFLGYRDVDKIRWGTPNFYKDKENLEYLKDPSFISRFMNLISVDLLCSNYGKLNEFTSDDILSIEVLDVLAPHMTMKNWARLLQPRNHGYMYLYPSLVVQLEAVEKYIDNGYIDRAIFIRNYESNLPSAFIMNHIDILSEEHSMELLSSRVFKPSSIKAITVDSMYYYLYCGTKDLTEYCYLTEVPTKYNMFQMFQKAKDMMVRYGNTRSRVFK